MHSSARPVIVGVGQVTDLSTPPDRAGAPIDLMSEAARRAASDCGGTPMWLRDLDSIVVIRSFADSSPRFRSPFGGPVNPPWSLARRLGATPSELIYTAVGGNIPQLVLSRAFDRIASGEQSLVLIVGAEAMRTELAARRVGLELDWNEDAPCEPDGFGKLQRSASDEELAHGLAAPINVYPIFEQAVRAVRGLSPAAHGHAMGRLLARFAEVARDNPYATRRDGFSADAIATASQGNPLIGFPYTRLMNANVFVDQAAALLVCSSERADALGIPAVQRVHLHGTAEGQDHWHFSHRPDLAASPAIRCVVRETLAMAECSLPDIAAFDIYSCFSSAIEVACREIGLDEDDPRPLTVTGGLPFFGGPGNNYVTHAIAEMVAWTRRNPGRFGLVTANGNVLTKHAAGIFSTQVPARPWHRDDPAVLQAELDRLPSLTLARSPTGAARIESYTVMHDKAGPRSGIIVARLDATGERFLANTPGGDDTQLIRFEQEDVLGAPGQVTSTGEHNDFTLTPT